VSETKSVTNVCQTAGVECMTRDSSLGGYVSSPFERAFPAAAPRFHLSRRAKWGIGIAGTLAFFGGSSLALAFGSPSPVTPTSTPTSQPVMMPAIPQVDTTPAANLSTTNESSTDITVNGQSIDVPENGSVHQTITDANGQTTIDASGAHSSTSDSSGSTSNKSSSKVRINSRSTSTTSSEVSNE